MAFNMHRTKKHIRHLHQDTQLVIHIAMLCKDVSNSGPLRTSMVGPGTTSYPTAPALSQTAVLKSSCLIVSKMTAFFIWLAAAKI